MEWVGSVDKGTAMTMWGILMVIGMALAYVRGGYLWKVVAWRNIVWIVLFLLFVSDHLFSVRFWQRVFHAPPPMVLYWIVVLAFGMYWGHGIRRDSEREAASVRPREEQ